MFSRAHLSIDKSRRGALFSDLHVAPRAHENVKYEQPPGEAGVHCCTAQAARVSGQAQALHERPVHLRHTVRSGDTQMTKLRAMREIVALQLGQCGNQVCV